MELCRCSCLSASKFSLGGGLQSEVLPIWVVQLTNVYGEITGNLKLIVLTLQEACIPHLNFV